MESKKFRSVSGYIKNFFQFEQNESTKLILSGISFAFIIGSYSILRSFKTPIFLGFVGREYEPLSKIISILFTVPAMLIYGKIIDGFKRHQAVYCIIGFYALCAFIFAYLFAHPAYGISNTQTNPFRLLGWSFELYMDLYQGLVLAVFWSFLNSVSTPTFAGKSYGPIVAASRIGGVITPVLSWFVLEKLALESTISIPLLTCCGGFFLLASAYCVYLIKKKIPRAELYGYPAAYKEAKHLEKNIKPSIFSGFKFILTEPYVLGIFGLVFCFEIVNIIFDYQMHVLMSIELNNDVLAMSKFMFIYTGTWQSLSFIFAAFGVSSLVKRLGVKRCLLVLPIMVAVLAMFPLISPSLKIFFVVMVLFRALNYGFNHPLKEILYIPTVKDIQFKSKAWIDSFGRTLSKATGSTINMSAMLTTPFFCLVFESFFALGVSGLWIFIAIFVGKRYFQTVSTQTIIGKKQ